VVLDAGPATGCQSTSVRSACFDTEFTGPPIPRCPSLVKRRGAASERRADVVGSLNRVDLLRVVTSVDWKF
jgi:hypothetical protein